VLFRSPGKIACRQPPSKHSVDAGRQGCDIVGVGGAELMDPGSTAACAVARDPYVAFARQGSSEFSLRVSGEIKAVCAGVRQGGEIVRLAGPELRDPAPGAAVVVAREPDVAVARDRPAEGAEGRSRDEDAARAIRGQRGAGVVGACTELNDPAPGAGSGVPRKPD